MANRLQVQLLLNDGRKDHNQTIEHRLGRAKRFECMVAFAKTSGLALILETLKKRLASGLKARFAVGLDFYQTEPDLLRDLLKLERAQKVELYVSDSSVTFHPKIYAVSDGTDAAVLIGSANLTGGGLKSNHEASALVEDPGGVFMRGITTYIDDLINRKVLVRGTKARIDEYERTYEINQVQQALARRRTEQARRRTNVETFGVNVQTLRDILDEMRRDTTDEGFEQHRLKRRANRRKAADAIVRFAAIEPSSPEEFLRKYEHLIGLFHSGGLNRGKTVIAEHPSAFQAAIADIVAFDRRDVGRTYGLLLQHFSNIPRAGVNVMTEILHALNPKRFAVMNQNAVAGLRLANVFDFPARPVKTYVTPDRYVAFCKAADQVRKELGLANFTELDALFNYAYWDRRGESDDD